MRLKKFSLRIFLAVSFFYFFADANAQSGWMCQNPNPQPDDLRGAFFINPDTGFMAGKGGTILKTVNAGVSWNLVYKNLSLSINSVSFRDNANGAAVCNSGIILRTSNSGDSWVLSPSIFKGTGGDLYKIQFIDNTTAFAVGDTGRVYKSTDGGATWDYRNIDGPSAIVKGLFFLNPSTGWVSISNGLVLRTIDGWDTWEESNTGLLNDIVSVFFIDSFTGWVTGQALSSNFKGFIYKSTDGGASWPTTQVFSPLANQYITDVSFTTNQAGIAVGQNGIYFSTSNGGTNWTLNSNLTTNSLYYVRMNLPGVSYIAGDNGIIMRSYNGGANWQSNSIFKDIRRIKFVNSLTGFMVGYQQEIYRTTDAGASWNSFSTGEQAYLQNIYMVDANTGWVCGAQGVVRKTSNGGLNWSVQNSGLSSNASYFSLHFLNSQTGWICGDASNIYKTTNGGLNWNGFGIESLNIFTYISFENASTGLTMSSNKKKIFKSTNGGVSWNQLHEFPNGDSISQVHFSNSLTGWISSYSKVLKTTDGAASWNASPLIQGVLWKGIYFINNSTGWVCAEDGRIMVTSNGGTNWTAQPVLALTDFNSVYFVDPNTGWVTGENSVLMKTTNGGNVFVTHLSSEIPEKFSLYQNYPNPFNPVTNIKFDIRKNSHVSLKVYDIQGREVSELVNERLSEGIYEVSFNGVNFASGIYFYTLKSDNFSETRKMIFIK